MPQLVGDENKIQVFIGGRPLEEEYDVPESRVVGDFLVARIVRDIKRAVSEICRKTKVTLRVGNRTSVLNLKAVWDHLAVYLKGVLRMITPSWPVIFHPGLLNPTPIR